MRFHGIMSRSHEFRINGINGISWHFFMFLARLMVSLKKSPPCQAGRRVMKVSPYDKTGVCYASLEDVPEKAGTRSRCRHRSNDSDVYEGGCGGCLWSGCLWSQVEAVNLIISPKIGVDVLNAMKKKGIRSVFAEMSSILFVFFFVFF